MFKKQNYKNLLKFWKGIYFGNLFYLKFGLRIILKIKINVSKIVNKIKFQIYQIMKKFKIIKIIKIIKIFKIIKKYWIIINLKYYKINNKNFNKYIIFKKFKIINNL